MGIATGFTASRMLAIENSTVVSGLVDINGDLILSTREGTLLNAGNVVGPPGQDGSDASVPDASTTVKGIIELSTDAETQAGTDPNLAVSPASLASLTATDSRRGLAEFADGPETAALASDSLAVTPIGLALPAVVGIRRVTPTSVTKSGGGTVVVDADGTIRVTANGVTAIQLNGILAVGKNAVIEFTSITNNDANNEMRLRKAGVDMATSSYVYDGTYFTSTWIGTQGNNGYGAIGNTQLLCVNGGTLAHTTIEFLNTESTSSRFWHIRTRSRTGSQGTTFYVSADNSSGTLDHDGVTLFAGGAHTFQIGTVIRVWEKQ